MVGLVCAIILTPLAIMALRGEGVRWKIAVLLGLVPGLISLFLGIFGALLGALITTAYWKIKLP
jgi:hypothetical protein